MSKKFKGFIYCITNKVNGKRYVGQTMNRDGVERRWYEHICELNRNKKGNKHFQNAWNKYGEDNFTFEVLHELNFSNQDTLQEALNDLEIMYISIWNLLDNKYGYNIRDGGSNGYSCAGKSKEEMKIIREKLSEANKGHRVTAKTRKKISEAHKGRKMSEESRKKMSESQKGKKHSIESIKKGVETRKGYKHSEETKRKIGEANRKKHPERCGSNHVNSKKVLCIELDKVFECASAAEAIYNKNHKRNADNIGACCRGRQKTAYGYHWQYVQ